MTKRINSSEFDQNVTEPTVEEKEKWIYIGTKLLYTIELS